MEVMLQCATAYYSLGNDANKLEKKDNMHGIPRHTNIFIIVFD